ncbi:MAG: Appr-1-p processing protein, partial [Bradyrhizobium sp.]
DEAEKLLTANSDAQTGERVDRISRLIEGFETPYGMELLATVHWAAGEKPEARFEEVVQAVQSWSDRKRQNMLPAHIKAAYDRLAAESWL